MDSAHNHDGPKRPRVRPLPIPRPSVSGDSHNGNSTYGSSISSNDLTAPPPHSRTSSTSTDPTADNHHPGDTRTVFLAGTTITESPISSPTLHDSQSPTPSAPPSRIKLARSRPVKKSSLLSNRSSSTSDLKATDEPSQSTRRWDDLRHHFLRAQLQPSTLAPSVQSGTPPPAVSDVPQRPSTSKQFRMPKLGFKHVVEQAQDTAADQSKKFRDDILSALSAMRSIEPKAPRREREGTLASMATSLNMGFMSSNATLEIASTSTSSYLPQSRAKALRRQASLQVVASHSQSVVITSLYNIISYHASSAPDQLQAAKFLPHENAVLFALLRPFMTPQGEAADSERLQALEAFEITVRTWKPASSEDFLERCIWCYRVARMIQDQRHVRMRVLAILSTCLFSSGHPFGTGSFITVQTLFQTLFSLQGSLLEEDDSEGASYVTELINDAKKARTDAQAVMDCMIIIALSACVENATYGEHQYVLNNESWFSATGSSHYSSSLLRIETRSIIQCSLALISFLLSTDGVRHTAEDCRLVLKILTEWLIPAANALVHDSSSDCRVMSARLALSILSLPKQEIGEVIGSLVQKWYRDQSLWKAAFENAIQIVVRENNWEVVVAILLALMDQVPLELYSLIAVKFVPTLNEKLVLDPPPLPFLPLTELLEILSKHFPKLFYKPLFACAAGSKVSYIRDHLRTVTMLARYLPSFWIRDAEMLMVAVMSNSGTIEKDLQESAGPSWGQVRLGKLVILVELIAYIQGTRQDKDERGPSSSTLLSQARFFFELEQRLGAFIVSKVSCVSHLSVFIVQSTLQGTHGPYTSAPEDFTGYPIFGNSAAFAFLETWLSRVISWIHSSEEDTQVPQNDPTSFLATLTEIYSALQQWSFMPQKRKSNGPLIPTGSMDGASMAAGPLATDPSPLLTFSTRERQLKSFSKGLITNALRLLVAVSGILSQENYESLGGFLWQGCLTQAPYEVQTSVRSYSSGASLINLSFITTVQATFLFMQCAENAPVRHTRSNSDRHQEVCLLDVIAVRIDGSSIAHSPQASRRLLAARRLSVMSGWRFQMLSQDYIVDKSHRRPFKLARAPMSFLPTDIGSSFFVLREDLHKGNSSSGQALPLELRKRLADIGWTQDESTMDQKHEWILTPFSLISGQQLEKVGAGLPTTIVNRSPQLRTPERPPSHVAEPMSPTPGVKRRPIFVPPLVLTLPDVASLVYDGDTGVANAARVAVMDWMRHDPALITRAAFDALSATETDLHPPFSVLRGYLYAQSVLPPAMAHHMFNHLAGFLKFSARERDGECALTGFAYAVPLLSKLVVQVNDMSLRELRRAKIDPFLIPTGPLSPSAPAGFVLPRSLSDVTSISDGDIKYQRDKVVLVRVAQNLLFASLLKRDRQEVQAFRKDISRLVLPTTVAPSTELRSFLPNKEGTSSFATGADAESSGLSLLLSRSHVLLVTEIFRSLPRHLNSRSELGVLIDGLNQILFVHGGDIGIVAHVLIALMTASARFHRLFTSGAGYTLFIPALFKAYAEAVTNEGVRRAIEYSINRFYAVHQEAFVFQVLNMLSQMVVLPGVDGPWIAEQIFLLLSTLKDDAPIQAADTAGIHGSNKTQEQEALMLRTAEEGPQAFLTLLRRSSASQGEDVGLAVPDQYEGGHFSLDNFIRLLLTVIGHDPSIRRAEQFLRLLRLLAPHFYDASPVARGVLLEGIDALTGIFIARSIGKSKAAENSQVRVEESSDAFSQAASASMDALEAAKGPSNFIEMKFDYLSLVAEFSKSGGTFGLSALRRILDLAKMMLRDSDPIGRERVASFLGTFAHNVLLRDLSNLELKHVLAFLNELGSIFKAHARTTDFSKMLEAVLGLVENPIYANQPAFSLVIHTHFCSSGLEVLEQLVSDGFASSTALRPVLVRLLCRAILLTGADVVSLIEQQPITFEFVAGILYPMALNLPSAAEIAGDARWMEAWRRAAIKRTWICLLQRAMQACQRQGSASTSDRPDKIPHPERRRSQKKSNVMENYPAATLTMALQTLKVIVLKAEDDLSVALPSIWVQMGLLFKNVLSAGNARFTMPAQGTSVPSSPLQSPMGLKPRASEDSDLLYPSSPRAASFDSHSPLVPPGPKPSLIDYLLWSILEFVCRRRSPLMLQMRLFIQEITATLDEEFHAQQSLTVRNKRFSYTSVYARTPQRSARWSKAPSPEASPFLTPIPPPRGDVFLTPPKPERKPGYARTPTPRGTGVMEPRIVHLGPVQNLDVFRRSPSPGLGVSGTKSRKWLMATSTTIKSAKLVLATYRRVRAVQRMMGYTVLIPSPDGAEGSIDDVRVWSKTIALNEIESETADIMEEFWSQDEE
ncbi:hypothetical protein F5148DRAFT_1285409 [Russula earlei]|uniref:Uncharacterized protein n=1 Tax=Russula earlei TaxID=71964 RepID=A0ACC0U865_9AGAM|nr:hypothetical protein F5148DRAFT_1285409 [Russula earlei]